MTDSKVALDPAPGKPRLTPRNWREFQHYKDRRPPWIKLHRSLLEDRAFMSLPVASKALAPLFWLLASESEDGGFSADLDDLEFRLRISKKELKSGIDGLLSAGLFVAASGVLAECLQHAPRSVSPLLSSEPLTSEAESVEKVGGEAAVGWFDSFWQTFGNKQGKAAALKEWNRIKNLDDALAATIIERAAAYHDAVIAAESISKHPSTWLHGRCWDDEDLPKPKPSSNGKPRREPLIPNFKNEAEIQEYYRET